MNPWVSGFMQLSLLSIPSVSLTEETDHNSTPKVLYTHLSVSLVITPLRLQDYQS